jgi:hypothetical protein
MDNKEVVKKVVISIPNEGVTRPESYDNHMLVAKYIGGLEERLKYEKISPRYEFYWHTVGRLLTPLARETLADQAIKGEMDYMIMFDDDMILPVDFVEAMLNVMEENEHIDILGALAFTRNPPHYPVMYTSVEGYDNVRHQTYFKNEYVKNYPRNKLVECDAVGFGGVAIRMDIFNEMKTPYFFSTSGTGEDIYFCYKAKKEANARVFMDTRIKLGHIMNPAIVDEDYFDKYNKEHDKDYSKEGLSKYEKTNRNNNTDI